MSDLLFLEKVRLIMGFVTEYDLVSPLDAEGTAALLDLIKDYLEKDAANVS